MPEKVLGGSSDKSPHPTGVREAAAPDVSREFAVAFPVPIGNVGGRGFRTQKQGGEGDAGEN